MWLGVAGRHLCLRWLARRSKQIVDPVPLVPLLHDVVPQMVEQLVDFLAPLDFRVPEQVIEVPKIVCPRRAARTILDVPQTAEQLVEVPTILSFISLQQQTVEQIVDIPVPGRERRSSGLQGFLPGQGSTAFRSSQKRISKQIVEQIVQNSVHPLLRTRTRGRNCLRTRAHGRRLLMTRPWRSRRRRRKSTRRSLPSSTWSVMAVGGGASGSQLASGIAGGWPLPMGPRLAISHGGRRGSSAPGDVSATMHDKFQQLPINSGWCLSSVHRPSGGYCRYATETGTHSVTLCFFWTGY